MIREFTLPDVGEGVAEGELVEWLVAPGDAVTEDQPVAEVETDKALVEIPSPYDGTVHELRAEPGDVVPVGEVLLTFDVPADGAAGTGEEGVTGTTEDSGAGAAEDGVEAAVEGGTADAADVSAVTDTTASGASGRPRGAVAPPSVRRLARERGVDLAAIAGSGPGGRVTEADVLAAAAEAGDAGASGGPSAGDRGAAEEGGPRDAPAPRDVSTDEATGAVAPGEDEGGGTEAGGPPAGDVAGPPAGDLAGQPAGRTPAGRDRTLAAPATRRLASEAGVDVDDVPTDERRDGEAFVTAEQVRAYAERGATAGAAGEPEPGVPTREAPTPSASGERVPYRGVRRTIGEHVAHAKRTAAHVTHHDVADATDLVALREDLNEVADVHLTYLPFVIRAVVDGLREFPTVNAQLDEERGEIVLRDEYNVGVATATDAGLLVPVVHDADSKGLQALAREARELADRARDRSITRPELQGGTFTVTNVGSIGGEYATPIVNYPEVGILALGAIRDRPRALDGEVVARKTLPLSLSIDHRVLDGAVAAEFTNHVISLLETPARLLLD